MKREEIAHLLPLKESFDLLEKPVVIGGRQCSVFFLDGFMKDDLFQRILQFFFSITPEQMDALTDLEDFCRHFLPYTEYAVTERPEEAAQAVLSGPSVLVIEGFAGAVVMDARTYPSRRRTRCCGVRGTGSPRRWSLTPPSSAGASATRG